MVYVFARLERRRPVFDEFLRRRLCGGERLARAHTLVKRMEIVARRHDLVGDLPVAQHDVHIDHRCGRGETVTARIDVDDKRHENLPWRRFLRLCEMRESAVLDVFFRFSVYHEAEAMNSVAA